MLAWQLCDLSGDLDQYCSKTLYFCDFPEGGGGGWGGGGWGSGPPVPTLNPPMVQIIDLLMTKDNFLKCVRA